MTVCCENLYHTSFANEAIAERMRQERARDEAQGLFGSQRGRKIRAHENLVVVYHVEAARTRPVRQWTALSFRCVDTRNIPLLIARRQVPTKSHSKSIYFQHICAVSTQAVPKNEPSRKYNQLGKSTVNGYCIADNLIAQVALRPEERECVDSVKAQTSHDQVSAWITPNEDKLIDVDEDVVLPVELQLFPQGFASLSSSKFSHIRGKSVDDHRVLELQASWTELVMPGDSFRACGTSESAVDLTLRLAVWSSPSTDVE